MIWNEGQVVEGQVYCDISGERWLIVDASFAPCKATNAKGEWAKFLYGGRFITGCFFLFSWGHDIKKNLVCKAEDYDRYISRLTRT